MSTPSTAQLELARRLLTREVRSPPDPAGAAARMYEGVLAHLSPLIGTAGVHALLARSINLAKAEHPCLNDFHTLSVVPHPDELGSPSERLRDCLQKQQPLETLEPAVIVFANLFALLTAFIGDRLTIQVIAGAWPELSESLPVERNR